MKNTEFSEFFNDFLNKKKYKLEYVASETGFSLAAIGHYKTGFRVPNDEFVEKFISTFYFSVEEGEHIRNIVNRDRTPERIRKQLDKLELQVKMRTIPVYSSVSAGLGRVPDAEPIDFISIPETTGDVVAVKVTGNSMEPTFSDGDIVVIKKDVEINVGDVGVFFLNEYDGEGVVKRLKYKNGVYVLESDNPTYEDKEIGSDVIIPCGKVVNIIKTDLSKKKVDPLTEKLEKLDQNQRAMLESMLDGLIGKK
ncbi:MAG: LexA family transcriptional regulator [Fusobacteriaceae bacterium]|nr:LexA family transcriptional regulator [Fusobacteriaceae bacterium]MBN2839147.1 LexA family transcriptional regulator [Fusobacteriaceae bacterium]